MPWVDETKVARHKRCGPARTVVNEVDKNGDQVIGDLTTTEFEAWVLDVGGAARLPVGIRAAVASLVTAIVGVCEVLQSSTNAPHRQATDAKEGIAHAWSSNYFPIVSG